MAPRSPPAPPIAVAPIGIVMQHKRHAVGRLLRTEVDVESHIEVVGQVDLVVEGDTACLILRVRREREGVVGGLVAR